MMIEFVIIFVVILFSSVVLMLTAINNSIEENKKELNEIKKDNYELSKLIIEDLNKIKFDRGD